MTIRSEKCYLAGKINVTPFKDLVRDCRFVQPF